MKSLYEYRIDEMAKLFPEDTGLDIVIFIYSCKRPTGHSGSVRIKIQNSNNANSRTWTSLAMTNPATNEIQVTGDVSKIPAKTLEAVKAWFIQNYAYLKKLSETDNAPDPDEIKASITKYVKTKPKLDEALNFDWKKYRYWVQSYCMGVKYNKTIAGVNLVLIAEAPSNLKPVILVQNNFKSSMEKFGTYPNTMVPVSIEREPKILSNGSLPDKVFNNVKKLITKNLNLLLGFWKGDEYDDDVYNALKATR